jgi:hypothetical protein
VIELTDDVFRNHPTATLLASSLDIAVPMWIDRLKQEPWDVIQRLASAASNVVAEKGDVILYRSKKKGETAEAFNALARGVACLAFAPGGVRFLGSKYEAQWEGEWPWCDACRSYHHPKNLTCNRLHKPEVVDVSEEGGGGDDQALPESQRSPPA